MESYTFKYLKGYALEMVAIALGIISLFVVVPFISGNKEIYGVYSLCISTWIFLSYADLGFLGAATKYAAEFFQLKKRKSEIEVLAFGSFILFVIACFISIFYLILSVCPEIIIKGIDKSLYLDTAKQLFLWMSIFSPFIALQRLSGCIYSVRVENYISQSVNIIGSLLKILSVFYFFTGGRYGIVQYFIFIQSVTVACSIVSFAIARKRYNYDLKMLFFSFRWNSKCFSITKDLALSSFANTLSWICYYEIDQIVIAKFYGATQVATYAIAFAILNYVRMFLASLFSPFNARFAHFRAQNDIATLRGFFINIINIFLPIVLCPLLALFILSKDFVIAWSGTQYLDAVPLTMIFVLLNIFSFLSYPTGSMITVFEKTKTLKIMAITLPVVYWLGVIVMPKTLSILSFGIMKDLVFWLNIPIYSYICFKILDIRWQILFCKAFKYNIFPSILVIALSLICLNVMPFTEKGIVPLLRIVGIIILISMSGYFLSFLLNPYVKRYILNLFSKIIKKQ